MSQRVLVTGLGVVSPIGTDLEGYWEALLGNESLPGIYPFRRADYMPNCHFYRVQNWAPRDTTDSSPNLGASSKFLIYAAEMALQDAGMLDDIFDVNAGVSMANGLGDVDVIESEREGGPAVAPLDRFIFRAGATVASRFRLTGPNFTVSTACSAGLYSISLGCDAIQNGWADVMVVGGTEGFSRVAQACFNRLGALDSKNCRPFDAAREGTLFGEGAAILILESEAHARRRGWKHWYAQIEGHGGSCDGYHATAPDPSAQHTEAAMRRALHDAALSPEDIDCVMAHGTGTALNDVSESITLERVFGERIREVPVCAIKSKIGHGGGAAGAFSCLTAALAVDRGWIPPTANLTELDPRCHITAPSGVPVRAPLEHVLVNAYGFGGNNMSVVIGKSLDNVQ
ncbi:MAG: beta-ketoacyl-[acyl-carrier-protein] synthase family protein, partial [Acidiferrobacterales bacterium]